MMTSLTGALPLGAASRSQRPTELLNVSPPVLPPLPEPSTTLPRTTLTHASAWPAAGPLPVLAHCWTRPQPPAPVVTRSIHPVPPGLVVGSTRLVVSVAGLFHSPQSSAAARPGTA